MITSQYDLQLKELDEAAIIFINREDIEEEWKIEWAIKVFKHFDCWDYNDEQPDWHALKRKALSIRGAMEDDKGSS